MSNLATQNINFISDIAFIFLTSHLSFRKTSCLDQSLLWTAFSTTSELFSLVQSESLEYINKGYTEDIVVQLTHTTNIYNPWDWNNDKKN